MNRKQKIYRTNEKLYDTYEFLNTNQEDNTCIYNTNKSLFSTNQVQIFAMLDMPNDTARPMITGQN